MTGEWRSNQDGRLIGKSGLHGFGCWRDNADANNPDFLANCYQPAARSTGTLGCGDQRLQGLPILGNKVRPCDLAVLIGQCLATLPVDCEHRLIDFLIAGYGTKASPAKVPVDGRPIKGRGCIVPVRVVVCDRFHMENLTLNGELDGTRGALDIQIVCSERRRPLAEGREGKDEQHKCRQSQYRSADAGNLACCRHLGL